MDYYRYGKKEIDFLKNKDPLLGAAIDKIGMIKRRVNPDLFSALISSVISQQISTKAADTVEKRLLALVGEIKAENIYKVQESDIQKCGMSNRKAGYIKNIADLSIAGSIDFENLYSLEDEDFIRELIKIKGVGEWTAEMLLIHSLKRENILSFKDLGIRRGIEALYGLEELSKEKFRKFQHRYSPYGTVASIYLWEISSGAYNDELFT